MIIDNTYFIDEIYISHAKPSITDDVTQVENDIMNFINEYSRDCLVKSLGYSLFKEFSEQLDQAAPNGLKETADAKWDKLLNGGEFTDSQGVLRNWRGIRYKNVESGKYNRSLLANYVYWFYEQDQNTTRTDIGDVQEKAKNAKSKSRIPKVNNAWRKFIKEVQGTNIGPDIVCKEYGFGIDYFGQEGDEVSMYKFINETNNQAPDTYKDFRPKSWLQSNQMGI